MTDLSAVRVATEADEEQLVEHIRLHDGENGVYGCPHSVFPLDEAEVRNMLWRCFVKQGGIIGVIGEPGGPLEASICLLIAKLWHTKAYHIEELWTFVHPDKRKTRHARSMMAFAKQCALELRVPLIGGLIANDRTESKLRLYQRTYGDPKGAYFVFNGGESMEEPKEGVKFWDHPFPRPGVTVVETKGLSKADLADLARLKGKRVTGAGIAQHG